jgi:predicted ATP-grasp superfamily ATP-dependent carboligase
MMKKTVGAVVIGGDFQGLGVIRSLAEEGIPIFLLEYERSIARYSRYVSRYATNCSLLSNEGNSFPEYLISLAKNESLDGWVLFPNSDECVKLLSIHRDALQNWYRNPVPPWEIVSKFYYKQQAYEIAEKISIPIPRFYRATSLEGFLIQDMDFPVVLKPACKERYFPQARKKAVRADNRKEFETEYRRMSSIIDSSEIVVQELIEGGPKNLFSYATVFDGKRPLAGMMARRSRQHPMDFGQATTYAESVHIPELRALATKLLAEMRYTGLAEVEFMNDAKNGTFKFIEINGRPWGWHTLAKAAGTNLPLILFQFMNGGDTGRFEPLAGVKWIRLTTDIPTVFKEILGRRMTLKDYINSLKGKKTFAVFSRRDVLPFFFELALIPYLFKKRGF